MALIPKGPGCQFDGDVGGSGGRVGGEVEREGERGVGDRVVNRWVYCVCFYGFFYVFFFNSLPSRWEIVSGIENGRGGLGGMLYGTRNCG